MNISSVKKAIFALIILTLATGCATVKSPMMALYQNLQSPVNATGQKSGLREGQACISNVLGLWAIGDASIEAARQNGGISEISTVDQKITQIFTFYAELCTVVRGR